MAKYDVVVIGAGLGGLQCAYILSKQGKKVCVLEQNRLLGGCLQSFKRKGKTMDTGFHYVGGLDKGQPLNRLFDYFDLLNLPWQKLDSQAFDQIVYNGKNYFFCNGYDNFANRMTEYFPKYKKEIAEYVKFLEEVGYGIFSRFKKNTTGTNITDDVLFATNAYSFLKEKLGDDTLINVLSGTSLKMQLNKAKLPLYIFAQINSSFIQSAWRLKGGGMQIADSLANSIKKFGGEIFTNTKATKFIEQNGKISAVETSNGQIIEGNDFISNLHPAVTVNMGAETSFFRKIYRTRINNLQNGFGMFTANILLKPNKVNYQNRNIYIHETSDIWQEPNLLHSENPICALTSFGVPQKEQGQYAENIDLLCPMDYADVEKFNGTKIGSRGNEYEELKKQKAEKLINLAAKYIDGLKDGIDSVYTSTPLTYADYTATKNGAAYGIEKDCNKLMYTLLTPKTPAPNLYLTGQNLSLHGILGVSMTSFFTCAEITGIIPENIF